MLYSLSSVSFPKIREAVPLTVLQRGTSWRPFLGKQKPSTGDAKDRNNNAAQIQITEGFVLSTLSLSA